MVKTVIRRPAGTGAACLGGDLGDSPPQSVFFRIGHDTYRNSDVASCLQAFKPSFQFIKLGFDSFLG